MTQGSTPEHGPDEVEQLQPLAGLLALLFPGAGHLYLGQGRRAAWIAGGVLGLFFGGMLIGGIGVVDSGLFYSNKAREIYGRITGARVQLDRTEGEPIWFLGQSFVGPIAFVVDHVHQYSFKVRDPQQTDLLRPARPGEARDEQTGMARPARPGEQPPYTPSLSHVNEMGTLFCTIAGMLNLICVIDAAFHRRRPGVGG